MQWYPDMMRWSWGMGFGMILFWVLVIVLIVVLIRSLISGSNGNFQKDESPLEILKRRYASGEIDKTQFEEMKQHLKD